MNIQTSTAKVYHGGNRRWFTKKAAEWAEARKIAREVLCGCYHSQDPYEPDETCPYHELHSGHGGRNKLIQFILTSNYDPKNEDDQEVILSVALDLLKEQHEELKGLEDQTLTDILKL